MKRDLDLTRQLDPEVKFIAAGDPAHTQGYIGGHYTSLFGPYEEGVVHDGGRHWIDHNTMLLMGDVEVQWTYTPGIIEGVVYIEGPKQFGDPPTQVPVNAGAWHKFIVRRRAMWLCIYAEAESDLLAEKFGHPVAWTKERSDV